MEPEDIREGYNPKPIQSIEPKFRDLSTLPPEALKDPDYALKQLQKLGEQSKFGKLNVTCSKCHHCR